MIKTLREKIALGVFVLLIVFAGFVLTSYFSTGRTWNVAASFLDDTVGYMDGYTALVYSGTTEEPVKSASPGDNAYDVSQQSNGEASVGDSIGLRTLSILSDYNLTESDEVYVSEVNDLYQQKSAQVVTIDTTYPERYEKPCIVSASKKKVGVFSIDFYTTRPILKSYVKSLEEQGAEIIVCVTPRSTLLSSYEGIDVVIVTSASDTQVTTNGHHDGECFIVHTPLYGEVGVVTLTTNNVASAKVVDAL